MTTSCERHEAAGGRFLPLRCVTPTNTDHGGNEHRLAGLAAFGDAPRQRVEERGQREQAENLAQRPRAEDLLALRGEEPSATDLGGRRAVW